MVVITILAIFSCSKEEDRIAANKGLTLKTVPDEDWTKIGYISGSNIYFSDLQSRLMIALENERNTYFDTTGRTNLSVDFNTVHLEKFYENVSDTLSRLCQIYLIAEGILNDNNTSKSYSYRSSYESLLVCDNDIYIYTGNDPVRILGIGATTTNSCTGAPCSSCGFTYSWS